MTIIVDPAQRAGIEALARKLLIAKTAAVFSKEQGDKDMRAPQREPQSRSQRPRELP